MEKHKWLRAPRPFRTAEGGRAYFLLAPLPRAVFFFIDQQRLA